MNERIYLIGAALTGLLASRGMIPDYAASQSIEFADAILAKITPAPFAESKGEAKAE